MEPGAAFAASFGGAGDCASDWLHPVAAIRSSTSATGPRAEMRIRARLVYLKEQEPSESSTLAAGLS
jgi:hypothetical protein